MIIFKAILRTIIGILFGVAAGTALLPAFAAFYADKGSVIVVSSLFCGIVCFFAPTIRRAFGRAFLMLGTAVFALPISTFLFSGRAASETINAAKEGSEAAAVVGAGLAGAAMTGVATFVGLIIGSILLLVGLVLSLGGRREVIIFEEKKHRD